MTISTGGALDEQNCKSLIASIQRMLSTLATSHSAVPHGMERNVKRVNANCAIRTAAPRMQGL